MGQDGSSSGLWRDVQVRKRKDSDRYEILPIQDSLTLDQAFFIVIRACQQLAEKNDGMIIVGVAGHSGAGKTTFTEKVLNVMPSVAVIRMDNYHDHSQIIHEICDDPQGIDYETLLQNMRDLKAGKPAQVPIHDFNSICHIGYRTLEVPSSRIVFIEGIHALNVKLRPLLDLRVSVTGGAPFDLVKRVWRDTQRSESDQERQPIIHILETMYPTYKALVETDLRTADIKISNKFDSFSGFQNPTYILKSTSSGVTVDEIKAVVAEGYTETTEETYDIYLLPLDEDPESSQSYLRMRNRNGKYNLMFEEWITDSPFIISHKITIEVTLRLLEVLMALGYTIAAILKRTSHVFFDDRVCVKTECLEQLRRQYVKVTGKDRNYVKHVADQLGLEGSYVPHTYIEQIQLEELVNDVMALPDDLKSKLCIDDSSVSTPIEAVSRAAAERRMKCLTESIMSRLSKLAKNDLRSDLRNLDSQTPVADEGAITDVSLSDQMFKIYRRIDEVTSRIEELNSNNANISAYQKSQASEILDISRAQSQIMHQIKNVIGGRGDQASRMSVAGFVSIPLLLKLVIGGVSVFLFSVKSVR